MEKGKKQETGRVSQARKSMLVSLLLVACAGFLFLVCGAVLLWVFHHEAGVRLTTSELKELFSNKRSALEEIVKLAELEEDSILVSDCDIDMGLKTPRE